MQGAASTCVGVGFSPCVISCAIGGLGALLCTGVDSELGISFQAFTSPSGPV